WPEGLGSETAHRQDGRCVSLTPFVVHLTFVPLGQKFRFHEITRRAPDCFGRSDERRSGWIQRRRRTMKGSLPVRMKSCIKSWRQKQPKRRKARGAEPRAFRSLRFGRRYRTRTDDPHRVKV